MHLVDKDRKSYIGPFPAASTEENELRRQLQHNVTHLAFNKGERNVWYHDELQATAAYIADVFRELGFRLDTRAYEFWF